ncbi:MAG: hypothetical protein FJ315_08035, partial [SAR202 cluster bacterium]|nr:hypothetical protein [SAR202 cluster bacterium]
DPHQFSIRWEGSLEAPETGEYEFLVRTGHAVRFWLNGSRDPLVDAWVKSGNETEFTGSVFLLAGRTYPLRLEFSKANQGVDDTNKLAGRPGARLEAPPGGGRADSAAGVPARVRPRGLRSHNAVPTGRSQHRLRAGFFRLEGVG